MFHSFSSNTSPVLHPLRFHFPAFYFTFFAIVYYILSPASLTRDPPVKTRWIYLVGRATRAEEVAWFSMTSWNSVASRRCKPEEGIMSGDLLNLIFFSLFIFHLSFSFCCSASSMILISRYYAFPIMPCSSYHDYHLSPFILIHLFFLHLV
jgi:hypothetical protein